MLWQWPIDFLSPKIERGGGPNVTLPKYVLRVIWNMYVIFLRIFKVQLVDNQPPRELGVEELGILVINMYLSYKILRCNLGLGGALVLTPSTLYAE